jgi:Spy/CpxP family protein refolding chaperone
MKTRWHLIGVGLIALSLVGAMTAYGRSGFGHGGHRFGYGGVGFPPPVLRALNLTAEQQTQIQTITEARRETLEKLRKEMWSAQNEVTNKLLASGDLRTEDFTNQAEHISALEAQLFKEQLAVGLEVRKVLTQDQLAQAAEIIAQKRARWAERKGSPKTEQ